MSSDSKPELESPEVNIEPLDYKTVFKDQEPSKFVDPCAAAAKATINCMTATEFDRDKCMDFFKVYRVCKKTWIEQRKDDRRNGRPTV